MNELLKRILTAIVFATLVIGSLILHPLAFALVLFCFIVIASFEWLRITKHLGHTLPISLLLIFSFWLFLPVVLLAAKLDILVGLAVLSLLLILPVAGIIELFRNKENAVTNLMVLGSGMLYFVFPLILMMLLAQKEAFAFCPESYTLPLFLFIVIWTFDTFAYFIGSLIGKHKLFERISPKKTWEGFIGGALTTMALAYFALPYLLNLPKNFMLAGSTIIVIFATFGDLFESMLKRKAGIKDSGTFLPGHGGVLDRLDSVFFAAPAFFIFCILYFMM